MGRNDIDMTISAIAGSRLSVSRRPATGWSATEIAPPSRTAERRPGRRRGNRPGPNEPNTRAGPIAPAPAPCQTAELPSPHGRRRTGPQDVANPRALPRPRLLHPPRRPRLRRARDPGEGRLFRFARRAARGGRPGGRDRHLLQLPPATHPPR